MARWSMGVLMQEEPPISTLRTMLRFKERVPVLSVAIG